MAYDYYGYNPGETDYQDEWNNAAATQNAAVNQQRLASLPDPRQLAAQALVKRYEPKPSSYSNINGSYEINGSPYQAPDGINPEMAAQHQFVQAKQQAAQDYLNRQSGDYAAGTAGRTMLRDPSFLGLPDDATRNQLYQQVYGNSLGEDQQADRLGGHMTMRDVRYQNAEPERLKAENAWTTGAQNFYGAHPGMLVATWDPITKTSELPGEWVMEKDMYGQEHPVQKPGKKIQVDPNFIAAARQHLGVYSGMQRQGMTQQPQAQSFTGPNSSAFWDKGEGSLGAGMQPNGQMRDQAKDAKLQNAFQTAKPKLQQMGFNIPDNQLPQVLENATALAGGQHFNDEHLLSAAHMFVMQQHLAPANNAMQAYGAFERQRNLQQRAAEIQRSADRSPFGQELDAQAAMGQWGAGGGAF